MITRQTQWKSMPARLPLSESDVHVWRAEIPLSREPPPATDSILSAEELERADRYLQAEHRSRFIVCRATVRRILALHAGLVPSELAFVCGEHGKPFLAPRSGRQGIDFSVSHSSGLLLVAVTSGRRIGVDVERIRPEVDTTGIARRFFSRRESAAIAALPQRLQVDAFFACWTRKESYLKATGTGLSDPLDRFDVSVHPDKPAALLHHATEPSECVRWSMQHLAPGAGYVGALTVESGACRIHQWDWLHPFDVDGAGRAGNGTFRGDETAD